VSRLLSTRISPWPGRASRTRSTSPPRTAVSNSTAVGSSSGNVTVVAALVMAINDRSAGVGLVEAAAAG
jgi:hypothetical protein